MIQSMTAFARQSAEGEWGTLVWEIRSVNQRYLELSLRMPEGFREIEANLRETVRHSIQRGKVEGDFGVMCPRPLLPPEVKINKGLLLSLVDAGKQIEQICHTGNELQTMDLLRWEGVVTIANGELATLFPQVSQAFKHALEQLTEARLREGAAMQAVLLEKLHKMSALIQTVQGLYPDAVNAFRERMQIRLIEMQQKLDADRLEQEVALLAYKSDINEEIDRLKTHCHEVTRILKSDTAAGRRLDFLMQELNREANTLSSKSIHVGITSAAVEMKVLIEQMQRTSTKHRIRDSL